MSDETSGRTYAALMIAAHVRLSRPAASFEDAMRAAYAALDEHYDTPVDDETAVQVVASAIAHWESR